MINMHWCAFVCMNIKSLTPVIVIAEEEFWKWGLWELMYFLDQSKPAFFIRGFVLTFICGISSSLWKFSSYIAESKNLQAVHSISTLVHILHNRREMRFSQKKLWWWRNKDDDDDSVTTFVHILPVLYTIARRWAFSDRLWWWRWCRWCWRWWQLHWWQLGGGWWRIAMADHPRQIEQQLLNQGRGRMIDCSHYNTSSSAHPILTSIIKVSLKISAIVWSGLKKHPFNLCTFITSKVAIICHQRT